MHEAIELVQVLKCCCPSLELVIPGIGADDGIMSRKRQFVLER